MYELLKKHLYKFSIAKLRYYLGTNISEALLEWTNDDNTIFDRDKLINMILSVHGLSIFKNKEFRGDLLKTFSKAQLYSLRDLLPNNLRSCDDLNTIVNEISNKSWGNNNFSKSIIAMLGLDSSVLENRDTSVITAETLSSDSRFYELLDYQFFIKQQVLFRLNIGNDRMLVHMPTGTGKTKTAMHTICHYINFTLKKQGLIIWIAHSTELLQQAYDTFASVWKHLGSNDIEAYKLWGPSTPFFESDNINGIMFCGIQKLMSIKDSNPELFNKIRKNCRLIAYDEAHKAGAIRTKEILGDLMRLDVGMPHRALLGLTATPGRATEHDVSNQLLSELFDDRLIGIDIGLMNSFNMPAIYARNADPNTDNVIAYFQERKILAKLRKEQLTYESTLTASELEHLRKTAENNGINDFSKSQLELIGKNKKRNFAIFNRLLQLANDAMPTIVFACSVIHAKLLSAMLTIQNVPNAVVIGDMLPVERENAIKQFKDKTNGINILINYEVLTTGFDSTNIKCVFITRPTKSVVLYSQMIGRGLRGPQMGGNEECLLIDLKDNLTNFDANMAFSHFDNYWRN